MRDPRLDKLAKVLVHYSVKVQPGQIVALQSDPIAMPLLEAIYDALIDAGAHVHFGCAPSYFGESLLRRGSDEQLTHVSPIAKYIVETIDARIGLWAETNTKAMSAIDPKRQALMSSARKPIFELFMKRAAWR